MKIVAALLVAFSMIGVNACGGMTQIDPPSLHRARAGHVAVADPIIGPHPSADPAAEPRIRRIGRLLFNSR